MRYLFLACLFFLWALPARACECTGDDIPCTCGSKCDCGSAKPVQVAAGPIIRAIFGDRVLRQSNCVGGNCATTPLSAGTFVAPLPTPVPTAPVPATKGKSDTPLSVPSPVTYFYQAIEPPMLTQYEQPTRHRWFRLWPAQR